MMNQQMTKRKKPDEPKKDTGGDKESDTKIKSRNF